MNELAKRNSSLLSETEQFDDAFTDMRNMFTSLFYPGFQNIQRLKRTGLSLYKENTDDGVIYSLPVPGCSEEDVNVELNGTQLSINAEIETAGFSADYSTTFNVSSKYNLENVTAEVNNGLLTISIPWNENVTKGNKRTIL